MSQFVVTRIPIRGNAPGHAEHCKQRRAADCAIAISCEHGFDCCPTCDPCTCHGPIPKAAQAKRSGALAP